MDIRLIVVDLDGTLMQKDETVSPRRRQPLPGHGEGNPRGGGDGALDGGGTARRGGHRG